MVRRTDSTDIIVAVDWYVWKPNKQTNMKSVSIKSFTILNTSAQDFGATAYVHSSLLGFY